MSTRQGQDRRSRRFHGATGDGGQACAHGDCPHPGEFRAPRRADEQGDGRWKYLCLDHVRQFNAGYNFFEGMDDEQIRAAQHPISGWADRTTWADGRPATPRWQDFSDPMDALGARFHDLKGKVRPDGKPLSDADSRALKVLGLDHKADRKTIRRAYSEKLRRYHPDRNGGDRTHEKALQQVISAYTHLRKNTAFG